LRLRAENAQVAVYLAYVARAGRAFIGRALYLPESRARDPAMVSPAWEANPQLSNA
jgi:SRSO17 transposase